MPSGHSDPSFNKIAGLVIRCPTFLLSNKDLPCNTIFLPFGDKYCLSKFNFLRIVLLFFLNFDVKFPFIKDSQFLYPSTLSSASTAATLSSWSQIVEIADSKIIS